MSFTRKVAYNTFVQIFGKGFGTILGLLSVALMTRYLGTTGFGYYATIITYLTFFGVIIEFGFHLTTLQLISEKKIQKDKLLSNVITLRLITSVIAFAIAPIAIWFFPYPYLVKVGVVIVTVSFFFITLNQVMISVLQYNMHMSKASVAEVMGRVVLVAGVIVSIWLDLGFLYIMTAIVAGSFINFLLNYLAAQKYITFQLAFDTKIWGIVLGRSWPIGLSIFFNLLYLKSDMLILSLVDTQESVGVYGATYRFLDVLTTLPAMFMGLILPALRLSWVKKDKEKFQRIFQKAFDFFVVLVVPMIFGIWVTADSIIGIIAGPEFVQAIPLLQIVSLSLLAIFIGGGLFGYSIIALNKQRTMIFGYVITAIISLSVYLYVIPRYSYYGAAWGTVFSECLISLLVIFVVYKTTKFFPKLLVFLKSIFAGGVMAYVTYLCASYGFFVQLMVAVIVYAVIMIAIKGISREQIQEILAFKK